MGSSCYQLPIHSYLLGLGHIPPWLLSAFREKKGYFVPKKDVFGAYADFCAQHHYESTTPASFGKFLKKIFPGVETRRLIRNNEQAMYYYNLTSTAAPASSRRWTSVQSSSTAPIPSTGLSSSTPAHSIYASSSSSSSSSSSPQGARRRRTSSLESQQPTEPRFHHPQAQRPQLVDHHHAAQQQQRLCRSASPSHAMFGEFATAAAHTHHHAPSSTLPAPPTFQSPMPSPSPSLSSSWSADARRIRSLSPTRPRRGGDDEEQGYEGHRLSSSGEAPHHIDDLVVASMRRIKEERQLPSHGVSPTSQRQGHYPQQQPPQPQPWQYQYQHHPYYQLMSTMSAQHPSDVAAASFAAAALQLPGVAFASSSSSSSTTYDASAWAGVDYLHPLMAALPHSAMALAAAAAAASHHQHLQELQQSHHHHHQQQQQLESRPSSLSAVSPPMVFTTATSTTTTAATALPSPVFARHALAPATATVLKQRGRLPDGAAAGTKRRRGEQGDGEYQYEGEKPSEDGEEDKPQPTIKDEPHDYHDSYAAAASSSSSSSSPTTNDCASSGGRKKKSRLDFILN